MRLIEQADPERLSDARMILFNCWTGLSLSEFVALSIEDIDGEAGVLRALVSGEFKVPKERSRTRTVELIDPALAPTASATG